MPDNIADNIADNIDGEEAARPASHPALRLVYMSPAELAENPANWRRHPDEQIAALTGVISQVGWAGACLYNERTGRLIDGHARRKVALEQGSEKVPVLVGSWSEEDERKILASLDPIGEMARADNESLAALLRELKEGDGADLAGIGWPDHKVDVLLAADWSPPALDEGAGFGDGGPGSDGDEGHKVTLTDEQYQVVTEAAAAYRKAEGLPALGLADSMGCICRCYLAAGANEEEGGA